MANQTQSTIQQCSFSGRWICLPDDCLGAAGCVASAMMMYAHLPWLPASSLTAETAGGRGGKEESKDRMEVEKRGDRERGVDAFSGNAWGEGEEKAKELESCIHY